ncbi:hypothetical protein GCM10010177_47700 [Actinomadura citrea]|nr:hypothetical protein GCM10010177_47700 [Actinomadura citrea]
MGPVDEASGEAGVGEDESAGGCGQVRTEQGGLGAAAVLDAGGAHGDGEQQAEGVFGASSKLAMRVRFPSPAPLIKAVS